MREGWEQTTLGEIARLIKERNSSKHLTRVMTVSAAEGLVDQESYFKKSVASANLANYRVVNPGDFVYNKSTSKDAPMGVITQWTGGAPVLVSPIYLVFRTKSANSSDTYLGHYFRSDRFFDSLKGLLREGARAHGALNVRQDEFLSAELSLPPLHEQQRIVDLMDSVDAAISAAQAEVNAVGSLMGRHRDLNLWSTTERTWLNNLCTVDGKLVDPAGENSDKIHVGTNRIVGGTGDIVGAISAGSEGVTSGKYPFDNRHVIYSKIRPNLKKVARPSFAGLCSADAYPLLPKEGITRIYLQQLLLSTPFTVAAVSRSSRTKMPKVNRTELMGIEIPYRSVREIEQESAVLAAMDACRITSQATLDRLRDLRSSMLTVLLSGEHEIPESYDQFLTESVEAQVV